MKKLIFIICHYLPGRYYLENGRYGWLRNIDPDVHG